jgi:hypothetical protein
VARGEEGEAHDSCHGLLLSASIFFSRPLAIISLIYIRQPSPAALSTHPAHPFTLFPHIPIVVVDCEIFLVLLPPPARHARLTRFVGSAILFSFF